jgi:hypothetical protein
VWEQLAIQGGPWGLIALVVVSLIRGWLIPRTTHLDRVNDFKAAIAAKDATIAEQKDQISALLGRAREPMR